MMTEKTKETLERTERALCMHLDVLDGEIERAGGDVKNHMVIDGVKDAVKSIRNIHETMMMSNGNVAAKQAAVTVTAVK
jgi:hypothetical protein